MIAMAVATAVVGIAQGISDKNDAKAGASKSRAKAQERALENSKKIKENAYKALNDTLYNNAMSNFEMVRESEKAIGEVRSQQAGLSNQGLGEGSSAIADIERVTNDSMNESFENIAFETGQKIQSINDNSSDAMKNNETSVNEAQDQIRKQERQSVNQANSQMMSSAMEGAGAVAGGMDFGGATPNTTSMGAETFKAPSAELKSGFKNPYSNTGSGNTGTTSSDPTKLKSNFKNPFKNTWSGNMKFGGM